MIDPIRLRSIFRDVPLAALLSSVVQAEDALARLDERVTRNPLGEGFRQRADFFDAAAALFVSGQLLHVEDLVLHDAHMDARAPTHELGIGHAVVRARRRIWQLNPEWIRNFADLSALCTGETNAEPSDGVKEKARAVSEPKEPFAIDFSEIDAIIARSARVIESGFDLTSAEDGVGAATDDEWDEERRIREWYRLLNEADLLPAVLGATLLFEAWNVLEPSRHRHWMGALLASAYLRQRGKVSSHLLSFNVGLRAISFERRRAPKRETRILAFLDAMTEAAQSGLREIDRLQLARSQMELRSASGRSNSVLPIVAELVLSRPIVSAAMIADHAKITERGARDAVTRLGLREITGRGRYRGWGIL